MPSSCSTGLRRPSTCEAARASRAIAVVMSGALVAAWLGPELAVRTADLVPSAHYAGSFYAGTGLYLLAAVLLSRMGSLATAAAIAADAAPPRRLGRSPRSRCSASRCSRRSPPTR